jgi:hypothetical protein
VSGAFMDRIIIHRNAFVKPSLLATLSQPSHIPSDSRKALDMFLGLS